MMPPQEDIQRRRPVWEALSDLFLDTELTEDGYRSIAERIVASGYSPPEIHTILWDEVFPAVECNLELPAGEWSSFDGEWLQERILGRRPDRSILERVAAAWPVGPASIVRKEWAALLRYLPNSFRAPWRSGDMS